MALNEAWYRLTRASDAHEETARAAADVRAWYDERERVIVNSVSARYWYKTLRTRVAARDRKRLQERQVMFEAYLAFHEARYASVTSGLNSDSYWVGFERELKDAWPLWPNQ